MFKSHCTKAGRRKKEIMAKKPKTSRLSEACFAYFNECCKVRPEQALLATDPRPSDLRQLQSNVFAAYFSYLDTQNAGRDPDRRKPGFEIKKSAHHEKKIQLQSKSTSRIPVKRQVVNKTATGKAVKLSCPEAHGRPVDEPEEKVKPEQHTLPQSESSLEPASVKKLNEATVTGRDGILAKEISRKRKSPNHFVCIRISNLEIHQGYFKGRKGEGA